MDEPKKQPVKSNDQQSLYIEIPAELKTRLKVEAATNNKTLRQVVLNKLFDPSKNIRG